jgi:chaperonin GroES
VSKIKKDLIKFIPAPSKVLVRIIEPSPITSGGILIPDTAKMRPMEGTVIAVGKSKSSMTGNLWKVKDHVLYGRYDGVEIRIDEEDFLLLDNDQILGKRD